MRAGATAAQPTLSLESASVLKHSLALARRRGHAQATPLHVAATLLTPSASLLRAACLKSQPPHPPSHPLQCRALELCFNVALNRLPAASPVPASAPLHHRGQLPSLSNALIAALKRAQAHQRRGCIEQNHHHQHPAPASPPPAITVKVELEQLILSILDDPSVSRVMKEAGFSSTSIKNIIENSTPSFNSVLNLYNPSGGVFSAPNYPPILTNRTTYINPKFPSIPQNPNFHEEIKLILGILNNSKRRNTVILGDSTSTAEVLISDLMTKIETDNVPDGLKSAKLIKFQVSSLPLRFMSRQEVDTNITDLKKRVESYGRVIIYVGDLQWAVNERLSTVDHLIAEIGQLLFWGNNNCGNTRVWLMAAANYQMYMKLKMKEPLLDAQWDLQPVSVPCGGLGLSLNAASGSPSPVLDKKLLYHKEEEDVPVLTCCPDCISNYEKEAVYKSSQLPFWLKSCATDHHKDELIQLIRRYNKLCQSLHQGSQNRHDSSRCSLYSAPCWPYPAAEPNQTQLLRQHSSIGSNSDSLRSTEDYKEEKLTLALGTRGMVEDVGDVLKENVPWQMESIPLIVEALNEDKVILFQGNDFVGKRRVAVGIAKAVFGSSDLLLCLNMRNNTNTVSENCEMLEKALQNGEKLVILIEDVNYADPEFVRFLVDILKSYRRHNRQTIFLLTTDNESCYNMPRDEDVRKVIPMKLVVNESGQVLTKARNLDLKRRPNWDSPMRPVKCIRSNETEEVCSNGRFEQTKLFISSTHLDLNLNLNVRADENELAETGELSPNSSDLTRETTITEQHSIPEYLNRIKTRLVLNMNANQHEQAKQTLLSKFRRAYHDAVGLTEFGSFSVEEMVLDRVVQGMGMYLESVFETWVKDVFGTSLGMIGERGKVSVSVCLGLGGKGGEDGFRGTCLPERIPLCFITG